MEFKDRIKLLRKEQKMTQKTAAMRIGVTYRTYQNYEAGASLPNSNILRKIANIFGTSPDILLNGDVASDLKTLDEENNPELTALIGNAQALFLGGKLCEEDKKYVIDVLIEAYWISKQNREEEERRDG